MDTMHKINADTFAVRLTRAERELVQTGRVGGSTDPLHVSQRDFADLAGKVSRGKMRGTYTVWS